MTRWFFLIPCLLAGVGCEPVITPTPADETARDVSMDDFLGPVNIIQPQRDPADDPLTTRTLYMVYMRIGHVQVPTGMASGSERLWSYLDEEPVALYSTVLGLNGFRIGLGRPESWQDFRKALDRMTGRNFNTQAIQLFSNRPGSIVLKPSLPEQTIFTYFDDQTLTGADYPPGDNILTFAATNDLAQPDRVILTALPQIRSTRKVSRFEMDAGIPTFANRPVMFPFRPLTFQLSIPKGYYLVIGPGIQSRRPSSVAHHFLTFQRDGIEYETLLILHPQVVPLEYAPDPDQ